MKKLLLLLMLVLFLSGCSGVIMNAEFSELLDKTCAISDETANRAQQGELTQSQMKDALVKQAMTWRLFKNARDGKK